MNNIYIIGQNQQNFYYPKKFNFSYTNFQNLRKNRNKKNN